jgi:hypothetical protein
LADGGQSKSQGEGCPKAQASPGSGVNDLTAEEWAAVKDAWSGCAYCGATDGPLQRDCVLAISRGGRYSMDNVVPACASCNTSKCNEEVTTWLRRKRFDERGFLTRYVQIRATLAGAAADLTASVRKMPADSGVSCTDTHARG